LWSGYIYKTSTVCTSLRFSIMTQFIYALIHIVHEHINYQLPINTDRFD